MALKRSRKNSSAGHDMRSKLLRLKSTPKPSALKGNGSGVQNLSYIRKMVRKAKACGLTVVTTNGCFDIVHTGHIHYLEEAKKLGDLLVVGINSDSSVRRNKGNQRPIVPERERARVIAALKPVDAVFIFDDETPRVWLKILKPHIHVKGADRSMEHIIEREVVEEGGGKVVLVPYVKYHSTSDIIKKILR